MSRRIAWNRAAPPLLLVASTLAAHGQELRNAVAPPVPPPGAAQAASPASPASAAPLAPVAAQAGESVLLPRLRGIVLVPEPDPAQLRRQADGVDASASPVPAVPALIAYLRSAIGQPVSLASLDRLAAGMVRLLREDGQAFVSVWVPPQDVTAGTVRIVVRPSRVEGNVGVAGNSYFGTDSYLRWIRQAPGQPIALQALQEDLDWINRNPFRNATLAAEPGTQPDTTRLAVQVQERRPMRLFAGYENNGTKSTGEGRAFAGANWGNVFGRGDQATYQLRADSRFKRSITHSGGYDADLPWRHVLSISGAWSRSDPDLGPDFRQRGTTWQLGVRYQVPNAWKHGNWTANLAAGADYKYADNNLEFAAVPVFGAVTRVVQGVLQADLRQDRGASGGTSAVATVMLSPGNANGGNTDAAFALSRAGAPARYAYARLDLDNRHRFANAWAWNTSLALQLSGVPLLGSEQIGAGGTTLRGYPESAAFGDRGAVLQNELHAPAVQLAFAGGASLGAYMFLDAAVLQTRGPLAENVQLASVGVGADMQMGPNASLRLSLGFPLREPAGRTFASSRMQARFVWDF